MQTKALVSLAVFFLAVALALAAPATPEGWTQWGGPQRDFHAPSSGLAASWPESGPRKLWSRELGEGYSAILVEDGRLYTMYRKDPQEVVACLDAADGKTLWEFKYDAKTSDKHVHQFGDGPRATPLIAGDQLYAIGVAGQMHALNKKTGEKVWSHDLWKEFGGNVLDHGYSSSPLEYKDTVIVLAGGAGKSIVALDKKDGHVVWGALDFQNSYSSPRIFNINGQEQLVTFMATELIGVDPTNGKLLWKYGHENQWKQNINMPVVVGGNQLFLSASEAGSRGLKVTRNEDGTSAVSEVWSTRKVQFYHVTTVLDGDWVYGSTGQIAPAFMAAVNARTGEIGWRERGFSKANCVGADGRLLILDEDGKLYLAKATPQALVVQASTQLLDKVAWTVPTVVGKTLYARDKKTIVAVDLG
jgi:outer membrane protein assembly factor BamB